MVGVCIACNGLMIGSWAASGCSIFYYCSFRFRYWFLSSTWNGWCFVHVLFLLKLIPSNEIRFYFSRSMTNLFFFFRLKSGGGVGRRCATRALCVCHHGNRNAEKKKFCSRGDRFHRMDTGGKQTERVGEALATVTINNPRRPPPVCPGFLRFFGVSFFFSSFPFSFSVFGVLGDSRSWVFPWLHSFFFHFPGKLVMETEGMSRADDTSELRRWMRSLRSRSWEAIKFWLVR